MKVLAALLLAVSLAGCVTTQPPKPPQLILEVPSELLQKPEPLKTLKQ